MDVSIQRINSGREELGFYESGQDMGFSNDREESFRIFQGRLLDEYDAMTEEFGLTTIDATQPIAVQQQQVRRYVEPLLENAISVRGQSVPEALGKAGLTGRYIRPPMTRRPTEQEVADL